VAPWQVAVLGCSAIGCVAVIGLVVWLVIYLNKRRT
jgi:hypothetical protein